MLLVFDFSKVSCQVFEGDTAPHLTDQRSVRQIGLINQSVWIISARFTQMLSVWLLFHLPRYKLIHYSMSCCFEAVYSQTASQGQSSPHIGTVRCCLISTKNATGVNLDIFMTECQCDEKPLDCTSYLEKTNILSVGNLLIAEKPNDWDNLY